MKSEEQGTSFSLKMLEEKLVALDAERARLVLEITSLRNTSKLNSRTKEEVAVLGTPARKNLPISPAEKIQLFLTLFRCREDVFPKRWENKKTGKQGYSPVCANEWVKPICQKPRIKCAECNFKKFQPLNEEAASAHLKGLVTIGTYAIRDDDSCIFLACDFDESGWREDALAYKQIAEELGIDVGIERSRSGNGAHTWIFFQESIPARIARSLGTLILAKCTELNIKISLDSFDRLFPSQDYLPKGGFGNLIALPLQKAPRELGNTCFVDAQLKLIENQWEFLSNIKRISQSEIREILDRNLPKMNVVSKEDAFDDISWTTDQAIFDKSSLKQVDDLLTGETVEVMFGSMLSLSLIGMPGTIVSKLKKTASFANPEFYKLQRMRMQTYPHARFIFSGEMRPDEILLPRGVLDDVIKILSIAGAKVIIRDERIGKRKIKVEFSGELTAVQKDAVKIWKSTDLGILSAPPGAGKTVMACALIAQRKVSTLILVHRQQLLDQWKSQITRFLGIPAKEIGSLSGSKKKMTGRIDLATLQSLSRMDDLTEIVDKYSQIIIDECHHVPATSFEAILKQLPARYVLGLTATPFRKDGLEKILFQQCGPVRHEIKSVDGGLLTKSVAIHETGFRPSDQMGSKPPYYVLIHELTNDLNRNQLIAGAAVRSISSSLFPLLISDRKDHLDLLQSLIGREFEKMDAKTVPEMIRLDGDMTGKQRRYAIDQIGVIRNQGKPLLLLSTSSMIGEGFDLPELDTLILATPLSFEGRMIQYAGRLHRMAEGKTKIQIIDFVDPYSAMLLKMYRKRINAYRKMGYTIQDPLVLIGPRTSRKIRSSIENLEFSLTGPVVKETNPR